MTTTVAIISIGDMGMGQGKLLLANGFRVITSAAGRSEFTLNRARKANIEVVKTDQELLQQADVFYSIVPPREAIGLAKRIVSGLESLSPPRTKELFYVDLNAVSSPTAKTVASLFDSFPFVKFIDAGIMGFSPRLKDPEDTTSDPAQLSSWLRPSIPVAGPHKLPSRLMEVMNMRHIRDEIGAASGLKMCFASLNKGFAALALQAYTSAEALGIMDELKFEMDRVFPDLGQRAEHFAVICGPKAYRWVGEMEEIADTFDVAGFKKPEDGRGGGIFWAIRDLFRYMAEETSMGKERPEARETHTVDDVCAGFLKSFKEAEQEA